jgi:L-aminopeptidase/D-esterase-like protein
MLAVSTGLLPANASLTAFGAIAAEVVADAVVRAVMTATNVTGWTAGARFVNLRIA